MKKNISFSIIFLLTSTLLLTISCTNKNKSEPLNVDELLTNASSLVGETVVVEGLCIHVCSKSGMKLFLQDSDETKSIRTESNSTLGKFDPESVDKKVRIRGILMEEEIEAETHDHLDHIHGEEGEACETEKNAVMSYYIAAETYQIIE
jgi:hypothetical protein